MKEKNKTREAELEAMLHELVEAADLAMNACIQTEWRRATLDAIRRARVLLGRKPGEPT